MHRELMGTHRNFQERVGLHGSAQERHIMSDKFRHGRPINAQTSMHLPSAVVVAAVLFFLLLLWIFLNEKVPLNL